MLTIQGFYQILVDYYQNIVSASLTDEGTETILIKD